MCGMSSRSFSCVEKEISFTGIDFCISNASVLLGKLSNGISNLIGRLFQHAGNLFDFTLWNENGALMNRRKVPKRWKYKWRTSKYDSSVTFGFSLRFSDPFFFRTWHHAIYKQRNRFDGTIFKNKSFHENQMEVAYFQNIHKILLGSNVCGEWVMHIDQISEENSQII